MAFRFPPLISLGGPINGLPPAYISPMISVELQNDRIVLSKIREMRDQFGNKNSERWLKLVAKEYTKYIKKNKLSGKPLKKRSGKLFEAWRYERVGKGTWAVHAGMLPYSRVHEFGHHEQQFVRGYVRKDGTAVKSYIRDANITATHYFTSAIREAEPRILKAIDSLALRIIQGKQQAARRSGASD